MTAVERLYYANGRRLAADDFRLEQHYHIAMRRLLNRGLFTAGVVNGLEVSKVDATHVRVAPGLALDPAGREIVLPDEPVEDRTLAVPAQPPVTKLGGYFLVARYVEDRVPAGGEPCAPAVGADTARVRERAELVWTETYPAHNLYDPLKSSIDCAVVLALVSTTDACEIKNIEIGVRQYAHPTHVSQTTAYALEGEKDIDHQSPKVLHFHVRGGAANSVTLFLWGEKFSSIHYTELGNHTHTVSSTLSPVQVDLPPHQHDLTVTGTTPASPPTHGHGQHGHDKHHHDVWVGGSNRELPLAQAQILTSAAPLTPVIWTGGAFIPNTWYKRTGNPAGKNDPENRRQSDDNSWIVNATVPSSGVELDGDHTHGLTGNAAPSVPAKAPPHEHPFTAFNAPTGATAGTHGLPYQARSAARFEYFSELVVELDGTDITAEIADRLPSSFQRRLGNGQDTHPIVVEGAGPLDLLEIAGAAGRTIDVGPHKLVFRLAPNADGSANGGNVHYNLYVE